MAIEKIKQAPSKRMFLNLLVLGFLDWLILFSWALSLWGLNDFNTASQRIYQLAKQQSFAIKEFNNGLVINYLETNLNALPTKKLADKLNSTQLAVKNELNHLLPNTESELDDIFIKGFKVTQQLWSIMCLTASVIWIKIIILMASIPLFALVLLVGLVDGLNQRAIRTASLGRESSYVFHRLNHYFKYGFLVLLALWLALPISVTPALIFVPASLLLSVMASLTTSRFKKYL